MRTKPPPPSAGTLAELVICAVGLGFLHLPGAELPSVPPDLSLILLSVAGVLLFLSPPTPPPRPERHPRRGTDDASRTTPPAETFPDHR
jgi:hypothetical protein